MSGNVNNSLPLVGSFRLFIYSLLACLLIYQLNCFTLSVCLCLGHILFYFFLKIGGGAKNRKTGIKRIGKKDREHKQRTNRIAEIGGQGETRYQRIGRQRQIDGENKQRNSDRRRTGEQTGGKTEIEGQSRKDITKWPR